MDIEDLDTTLLNSLYAAEYIEYMLGLAEAEKAKENSNIENLGILGSGLNPEYAKKGE